MLGDSLSPEMLQVGQFPCLGTALKRINSSFPGRKKYKENHKENTLYHLHVLQRFLTQIVAAKWIPLPVERKRHF
jgi:hypothetical protein